MAAQQELTPYEAALHHYGQWYEILQVITDDTSQIAIDAQRIAIQCLSTEMWYAGAFRMVYLKLVINELKNLQIC